MTYQEGEIRQTPFGPIVYRNGHWVAANPRKVVDELPEPNEEYTSENPTVAWVEGADYTDSEVRRLRRLSTNMDHITMAHGNWAIINDLDPDEQMELAMDHRKLNNLALPFFSDTFDRGHAEFIKSMFPRRSIWFNEEEIL